MGREVEAMIEDSRWREKNEDGIFFSKGFGGKNRYKAVIICPGKL